MIHLDKEEFIKWLRRQTVGTLGRANRQGQTPLELFVLDTFSQYVNFKACAIPISLTSAGLWVYTNDGLTKVALPVWAEIFTRRSQHFIEEHRNGRFPSVGLSSCLGVFADHNTHTVAPKSMDAIMNEMMAMLRR